MFIRAVAMPFAFTIALLVRLGLGLLTNVARYTAKELNKHLTQKQNAKTPSRPA